MGAMSAEGERERKRLEFALARQDLELESALQRGEPGADERALLYLEADPWRFRSGYVKQRLFCYLRRYELSGEQRQRLQTVFIAHVDAGERWEFREACRCARRFQTSELRDALVDRLTTDDLGVAIRATRMVTTIRHPRLSEVDRSHARAALLLWAAGSRTYEGRWVPTVVQRLWSPVWGEDLVELAQGQPDLATTRAARLLLGSARRKATAPQRQDSSAPSRGPSRLDCRP